MQDPITMAMTSREKKRDEMSDGGGKTVPKIGHRRTTYKMNIPIPKMPACPKIQCALQDMGELAL
jgi:hypothetical protein